MSGSYSDELGWVDEGADDLDARLIEEDAIWQGRGAGTDDDASGYKLKILDIRRDGRVICERIAVPSNDRSALGEITVTPEQLLTAYEPIND